MSYPLVSIIIPVYNVEKYIVRCLTSVYDQTYSNIEVIIINDASPDHSDEVINEFLQGKNSKYKDFTFYLTNDVNLGLSNTRNRGIALSKGEYIFFLDSDDELGFPDAIEKMVKNMLTTHSDVCIAETQQIKNGEYFCNPYHLIKTSSQTLEGENIITHYLKGEWSAISCNRMYLKAFLMKNNMTFYPRLINEDELWSFEIYLKAMRICFLKEKTYKYYIGENKSSITATAKNNQHGMEIILFKKLELLKQKSIAYNCKPYSENLKNDIHKLLKPPAPILQWKKNYLRIKHKLIEFQIHLFLPAITAFLIHIFKLEKLQYKNIRFNK